MFFHSLWYSYQTDKRTFFSYFSHRQKCQLSIKIWPLRHQKTQAFATVLLLLILRYNVYNIVIINKCHHIIFDMLYYVSIIRPKKSFLFNTPFSSTQCPIKVFHDWNKSYEFFRVRRVPLTSFNRSNRPSTFDATDDLT